MENMTKQRILESIGNVYEKAKRCKLETSFFETIKDDIHLLSNYFHTTENQTFFISLVYALNYEGSTVSIKDLINYLDCNPMKILEYNDDFEHLYSVGIFEKEKNRRSMRIALANNEFSINEAISEAILSSQAIPEIQKKPDLDIYGLLEKLHDLGEQRDEEKISTNDLFNSVKVLIDAYTHFPLIQKIKLFNYNIEDTYIYLYIIWKTLTGRRGNIDISRALQGIHSSQTRRLDYLQKLISGENNLLKDELIDLEEADFINDIEVKLSENSNTLLKENGINILQNKKKKKENIIKPSEITKKELLFDPSEMKQLFVLKDLLQEDKFKETQTRLSDKGLPKGIIVLLHGAPGTGKTEIVKQLAIYTNREIMKVEISQSKSMWFGESEKIIKRIFTDYNAFAKESKQTPILLFNEADAILSKRNAAGSSNVAQTENAIQNILLEEFENFEGILIATTNLASNLDTAFERRFLYKVQFQKPSVNIRAKIWKIKLPLLEEMECQLLAEKFDFSGGQIDNIIRKNEIQEIVHGTMTNYENVLSFCKEETIGNQKSSIGFIKN
jgi:SpoVK/Ycf46/Vps4 family AAA+-type ATPase